MGSSIPAATDYLLGLAAQAAPGAVVADGWPTSLGRSMFGVGTDRPPIEDSGEAANGTRAFISLGAQRVDENYGIPCWIYQASGDPQKTLRDAAFAIFDQFYTLLRADLTLGGALSQYAAVNDLRVEGPKTADEAGKGQYCLVMFTVTCQNRY